MLLRRKKKKEKKKALAAAAAQLAASYDPSDPRSAVDQRPHSALPSYGIESQLEDLLEDSGSDEVSVDDFGSEHANPEGRDDITPTQSLPHLLSRYQTNTEHTLKKRMSQPAITFANMPSDSLSLQNLPIYQGASSTVVPPAPVSLQQPPPPQTSVAVAQSTPSSQDPKKSSPAYVTAKDKSRVVAHPNQLVAKVSPQKAELIKHVVELGLGRGIDATSRTPWTSKSTFQVRRVQPSVVETKELGTVGCYDHAIQGIQQMDQQFQASLSPPEAPISIYVEDESNRTTNSTRRVVGRRVINSTVGFQTDFEEKCSDGDALKFTRDSFLVPRDPSEVVFNTQNSSQTFEERVSQWILHRIAHRYALVGQKFDFFRAEGGSSVDRLAKLIHSKVVPKTEDYVKAGCKELIQGLRITHYVSSMKLGAVEYRVISEGEYNKKLAKGGAFGLDALVESFVKTPKNQSKKEASKCSQLRKLGSISQDGHVEPRSSDETVISIEVQPIARLLRLPVLKLAVQDAVEEYMDNALGADGGPFVIMCAGRNIYLTVNKYNQHEVEGTENPAEASLFYFVPTDDGGNPFDFHIAYYDEDIESTVEHSQSDVARYLEAPINAKGECSSPLYMKQSIKVRNSRFTLRSRLSKKHCKSHLSEWVSGEEAFYISCATNKKVQHGSYFAVKRMGSTDIKKHLFMTVCLPSIHHHNGTNTFMLFQLVPNCKEALSNLRMGGTTTPGKLPSPEQPVDCHTVAKKLEQKSVSQQALLVQ